MASEPRLANNSPIREPLVVEQERRAALIRAYASYGGAGSSFEEVPLDRVDPWLQADIRGAIGGQARRSRQEVRMIPRDNCWYRMDFLSDDHLNMPEGVRGSLVVEAAIRDLVPMIKNSNLHGYLFALLPNEQFKVLDRRLINGLLEDTRVYVDLYTFIEAVFSDTETPIDDDKMKRAFGKKKRLMGL